MGTVLKIVVPQVHIYVVIAWCLYTRTFLSLLRQCCVTLHAKCTPNFTSLMVSVFQVYRKEGPCPLKDSFEILEYYLTVLRRDFYENITGLLVQ